MAASNMESNKKTQIRLFEEQKVRTIWNAVNGKGENADWKVMKGDFNTACYEKHESETFELRRLNVKWQAKNSGEAKIERQSGEQKLF